MSTENRDRLLRLEKLSAFVDSPGWHELLALAEEEVIRPLRLRALGTPDLDPREHTGVVRSLNALKALLRLPYDQLSKARGLSPDVPDRIRKMFE